MANISRLGIDDDNVRFPPNNDRPLEEQLSTILSPLLKAQMELLLIRRYQNLKEPEIEALIRRIVRDYISSFLGDIQTRIPANVMQPSYCRTLQLRFMNKLAKQVFTGTKIEGENGTCIKIALVDEVTEEIVKSGPGASARTRIMMIDGNYMGEKDLNEKINEAIKRTEPRLKGDEILSLKEGIGYIDDLHFVHGRTWFNKDKFVLVATLVDSIDAIRVKAAVTEPFTITDHRNSLYAKKEIPSVDDSILRLKNIGRRSLIYKSLKESNITTVLTFLRELHLNPERLQQIVGTHMADKAFKATVSHAEKCMFDREELYKFNEVVFNIVGEIEGGYFGDCFHRFDVFSYENKVIARSIVLSAFASGNYSRHTINGSTFSDQIISSVNPQIGDMPGPSSTNIVLSAFESGNYSPHTINGSTVSDQIISSVNPQIEDMPAPSLVTDFEFDRDIIFDPSEFSDENNVIAQSIVPSAFESGNYSHHTVNGSTVSDQIFSSVNPQIEDMPGPSLVTDFEFDRDIFFDPSEFSDENNVIAQSIVPSAFESGNYSHHTINGSTFSDHLISSVNPQIGDMPGPSSVTDFEFDQDILFDAISRIAQKKWKLLHRMLRLVFMRRKVVVSDFVNDNNNAQKRQRIC